MQTIYFPCMSYYKSIEEKQKRKWKIDDEDLATKDLTKQSGKKEV